MEFSSFVKRPQRCSNLIQAYIDKLNKELKRRKETIIDPLLVEFSDLEEETNLRKAIKPPNRTVLSVSSFTIGNPQLKGLSLMKQAIAHVALVVREYDEAIDFYTKKLHFELVEDTFQPEQNKRWVLVAPPGSTGTMLLLARASKPEQEPFIGNQAGGRVFLFLQTDNFWRDYEEMLSLGIRFVREPKREPYGTVAVFEDLYGNLWDLVERGPDQQD